VLKLQETYNKEETGKKNTLKLKGERKIIQNHSHIKSTAENKASSSSESCCCP